MGNRGVNTNDQQEGVPVPATSQDVATWLRKPVRTINDMAARGDIPGARKIGKFWYFPALPDLNLLLLPVPERMDDDGHLDDLENGLPPMGGRGSQEGKAEKRLAPEGMGSRAAGIEIGPQLLREMEEEERGQSAPAERRLTLWQFCEEVYAVKHGVSDRTWRQREFKVAGIMTDLGDHLLTEVTTPVVTDWLELLQADGAPKKRGGRGQPLEEGGAAFNDYLVTLKAIFRVAVENDYIDKVGSETSWPPSTWPRIARRGPRP